MKAAYAVVGALTFVGVPEWVAWLLVASPALVLLYLTYKFLKVGWWLIKAGRWLITSPRGRWVALFLVIFTVGWYGLDFAKTFFAHSAQASAVRTLDGVHRDLLAQNHTPPAPPIKESAGKVAKGVWEGLTNGENWRILAKRADGMRQGGSWSDGPRTTWGETKKGAEELVVGAQVDPADYRATCTVVVPNWQTSVQADEKGFLVSAFPTTGGKTISFRLVRKNVDGREKWVPEFGFLGVNDATRMFASSVEGALLRDECPPERIFPPKEG